jgi:glycosyltransferase involved in cell wall biosynthesis
MKTALLALNEGSGDGRAEKFETRERLLNEQDWEQRVVTVPACLSPSLFVGTILTVRRARREDIDVIHSVSNPFHLHLVALVASLLSGRPWLAEFRDPLVTNPDVEPDSWQHTARKYVERLVVETADRVAWLDMIQLPENYFRDTYPSVPEERWLELPPVGYDSSLFEGTEQESYERFTVTYAGSFYEGWIEPYGFLDGLSRYVEERDDPDVHAQFYGDWNEAYSQYVTERGLSEYVTHHDFVPHEEIVPVLRGSDALLYVGGSDERNRRSVSSKMWDYIGARSPALAIADPSFRVTEFVQRHELGVTAPPDDPDRIAAAIDELANGAFEYEPDESVFDRYTRQSNARALVDEFEVLAG